MKYALCYVSTVRSSVSEEAIKEILEQSSRDNNKEGITGILLYSNGNFFQVLEGEEMAVLKLFEKIKQDNRHYDLITIFKKAISTPGFKTYQDQFLSLDTTYSPKDLELYASQVKKLDPEIQQSVKYILKNFS
ncbi:MAG: BLUF domain-containing protein [Salinimicrobium sp.]